MHPRDNVTAAKALDDVRRILREVLGGREVTVYLFGSWARGEATPISDIDLAIEASAPLPPETLARLRERLKESSMALDTLDELLRLARPSRVERDAAIQRFEYTFEACWRVVQPYFHCSRTGLTP